MAHGEIDKASEINPAAVYPTMEETVRAQEVYRYYQPHNPIESLATLESSSNEATNFATSQFLLDTALTALVQLIALRFEAQRAIVSLSDSEYEYFLAESTSTLSLLNADCYAQNHFLSSKSSKVPRAASLCEETLALALNQKISARSACIVPDLRLDGKLSRLKCVNEAPYLRFYCGVALTNNKGIAIGSIYVVDGTARTGVSFEQIQFLKMMAGTVMDYLENIRMKEELSRVTRMSQGLHAFIEGAGTMHGNWRRLKSYDMPAGAGIAYSWRSDGVDEPETFDGGRSDPLSKVTPPSNSDRRIKHNEALREREPLSTAVDYFSKQPERGNRHFRDALSNLRHKTFSRASNLVREGMEVDGAVYFDAPAGNNSLSPSESGSSSADENYADVGPGPQSHAMRSANPSMLANGRAEYAIDEAARLESNVLGFSTRKHSSFKGENRDDTDAFSVMDQSLLVSLVRRYPEGKRFAFGHHGATSPKGITVSMKRRRDHHKARKRAEIIRLLAVFPGARQIFFVPLYDPMSECFIGSFTWSTSDTRIFSTENDLSYLIVFGQSVMAELGRLNTLSADRAKDQFINNVSHELRSPLHGILASAEFLAGTSMDGFQRSLVDNVDDCGHSLLDTVEHILDFSKIKAFGRGIKQSLGVVTEVDISAVIEETLEGICAGLDIHGLFSHKLADITGHSNGDAPDVDGNTLSSKNSKVSIAKDIPTIILDIDFREQWRFHTVPSTWRRLTMNLLGNALKFTSEGWITVKLESRKISPLDMIQNDGKERTMVTLIISDSGRGISGDFMKTKLFMPFCQEDVTTQGTGLGMSISKEIVDLAGGVIDVRSEFGRGTQVKLSLPLENHLGQPADDVVIPISSSETSEDIILAVRRRVQGRTVTLRGFESCSATTYIQSQSLASLKASIQKYARDWFNLLLLSSESGNDVSADIVISDESVFLGLANLAGNELLNPEEVLLVLCSKGAKHDLYAASMESGRIIEFVSKPCGPRRLAKALQSCLDKENFKNANARKVDLRDLDVSAPKQRPKGFPGGILYKANRSSAIGTAEKAGRITSLQSRTEPSLSAMSRSMTSRVDVNKESKTADRPSPSRSSSSDTKYVSETPANSSHRSGSGNTTKSSSVTNASRKPSPNPSNSDPSMPLARRRMLLVEDNPVNMMLLSTYMRKNDWDFEKGENGLLALQIFENRPQGFDVIFMDISMPVMTGHESTREIRKVEMARRNIGGTNRPALIIALTGFTSQKDQEIAFESGADIFMTKPVRFKEVGRILDGWMKKWS